MLQEYHARVFHFLLLRVSIIYRRVFDKTISLLGLAGCEMIITNEAHGAELVVLSFHIQRALVE